MGPLWSSMSCICKVVADEGDGSTTLDLRIDGQARIGLLATWSYLGNPELLKCKKGSVRAQGWGKREERPQAL